VRVAYLGTSEFAVAVLRRLAESRHRPQLVVAPPDRPRGRGRRLASPPVALAARELGLEIHQARSVNDPHSAELIRDRADVALVCAFGQLIREPLLFDLEMLNIHPSLLPRWRGAAPIERAMLAGDSETGVTIIRLEAELDAGPIALQEKVAIGDRETFAELAARLAALGGELGERALDQREASGLEFRPQDDALASYAEKIAPAERRLDPTRPATELDRTVRALGTHIGVYLELQEGVRLGVREADAQGGELAVGELAVAGEALLLGCGEGVLRLQVVQPPGGRPMTAGDYLRGHPAPRLAAP
jgi:methionyl-tRNA formyltransferase